MAVLGGMLSVRVISGDEVVSMPMAQFAEMTKLEEHPVRYLKQLVGDVRRLSRFRLRLLQNGIELDDGTLLEGQADLELVQLTFSSASDAQVAELVAAAGDNEVAEVEHILGRPQNPDLGNPSPLVKASFGGHLEVARLLLEANADPDMMRLGRPWVYFIFPFLGFKRIMFRNPNP